jgi:hypothetical protein
MSTSPHRTPPDEVCAIGLAHDDTKAQTGGFNCHDICMKHADESPGIPACIYRLIMRIKPWLP